jgi:hypothetical protein
MKMVMPKIWGSSFALTISRVASNIFSSFEADFLLDVIAASLFLSPLRSEVRHYMVARCLIHEPVALPSKPAEPKQAKKVAPTYWATHLHLVHD